jgi:hypothetical protein
VDPALLAQQTKVRVRVDAGVAELLVVDPGDESCETTKVLTSASERKERVCEVNVVNWRIH